MITLEGKGVHSGAVSRVSISRHDGPVTFLRGGTSIPALAKSVTSTKRTTVLGSGGARVAMVEHLLAALHLSGWWHGLLIEVSSDELPVMDGSAAPWLTALSGLGDPPAAPEPLRTQELISVDAQTGAGTASWGPGEDWLEVSIRFDHPQIGSQNWSGPKEQWGQLADARTFGFLSELEQLRSQGLALGADTGNCLVFDTAGTVAPARSADEPVRHKALDLLGDLFLLGIPLAGRLRVACGSHSLHARLVREVLERTGLEKAI